MMAIILVIISTQSIVIALIDERQQSTGRTFLDGEEQEDWDTRIGLGGGPETVHGPYLPFGMDGEEAYILKARVPVVQTLQIILNFRREHKNY